MNNDGLPSITTEGRYNLAHICRRAVALYRRYNGCDRLDWRIAMKKAWTEARGEMQMFSMRNMHRVVVMREVARDTYLPVATISRELRA